MASPLPKVSLQRRQRRPLKPSKHSVRALKHLFRRHPKRHSVLNFVILLLLFTLPLSIGPDGAVIKAQVLAGGRGKGKFDNGLQGGVHKVARYAPFHQFTSERINI